MHSWSNKGKIYISMALLRASRMAKIPLYSGAIIYWRASKLPQRKITLILVSIQKAIIYISKHASLENTLFNRPSDLFFIWYLRCKYAANIWRRENESF